MKKYTHIPSGATYEAKLFSEKGDLPKWAVPQPGNTGIYLYEGHRRQKMRRGEMVTFGGAQMLFAGSMPPTAFHRMFTPLVSEDGDAAPVETDKNTASPKKTKVKFTRTNGI